MSLIDYLIPDVIVDKIIRKFTNDPVVTKQFDDLKVLLLASYTFEGSCKTEYESQFSAYLAEGGVVDQPKYEYYHSFTPYPGVETIRAYIPTEVWLGPIEETSNYGMLLNLVPPSNLSSKFSAGDEYRGKAQVDLRYHQFNPDDKWVSESGLQEMMDISRGAFVPNFQFFKKLVVEDLALDLGSKYASWFTTIKNLKFIKDNELSKHDIYDIVNAILVYWMLQVILGALKYPDLVAFGKNTTSYFSEAGIEEIKNNLDLDIKNTFTGTLYVGDHYGYSGWCPNRNKVINLSVDGEHKSERSALPRSSYGNLDLVYVYSPSKELEKGIKTTINIETTPPEGSPFSKEVTHGKDYHQSSLTHFWSYTFDFSKNGMLKDLTLTDIAKYLRELNIL